MVTGIGSLTVRLTLPAGAAQDLRGKASPIVFKVQTSPHGDLLEVQEKSTFFIPR
jgi:hypothetical protein